MHASEARRNGDRRKDGSGAWILGAALPADRRRGVDRRRRRNAPCDPKSRPQGC